MSELTIIGLTMVAGALFSAGPLFVWCVRDAAHREAMRRDR